MALYTPNEAPGSATPSRATIWAEIRKHSQIVPIASVAGRTALLASLAALTPPVTPSSASPVWVYRQDTGAIEMTSDGSTWTSWSPTTDWVNYTPILTGSGLGTSPTVTGRYQQIGKRVRGWAKVVLGASPSPSGVPTLSLPVPAASGESVMCTAKALSTGNNIFSLMADATSTAVAAGVSIASGMGALGGTTPFSWKAGDQITMTFDYEAA